MIADYEGDPKTLIEDQEEGLYPTLCMRDIVVFPTNMTPIVVGRKESLNLVRMLEKKPDTIFCVFCQKNKDTESPYEEDLYPVGVFAKLIKVIKMPGTEQMSIIIQGLGRCQMKHLVQKEPYTVIDVKSLPEKWPDENNDELFRMLYENFHYEATDYIKSNANYTDEAIQAINELSSIHMQCNFMCSLLPFSIEDKIKMLKEENLSERIMIAIRSLNKVRHLLRIQTEIENKTHYDLDEQQKEYFLKQQIKNIREELGEGNASPEKKEILEKAKKKNWSEETAKIFKKEIAKLDTLNPQSPDYSIQIGFLQTMVDLPWNSYTQDDLSLTRAKRILNHDHYGMENVKERILEFLAVRALNGGGKSPILCLYGPPGVGKTSLGKSIAAAMKRKYVRMSLGGLHDEAEIRGHRKTYIGAMPGRIIKSLIKAETSNPVIILDEIDKLSSDSHGDPSSAMLEVLDPEQNNTFHDNYVDIDYDLSNIMFIATANNLGTIPSPLLDRMELIEVSGYITEEKIEIARRHLIPKEMEKNGLKKEHVKFSKAAIEYIIENYTRESGVRELEKKISKVMRKIALEIASDEFTGTHELKPKDIEKFLGAQEYSRDKYQGNEYAGVVTGLAWTAVGGEILFVETSLSRGKGQLTLTGNLGSVMKESAMLALEYLKAHSHLLDLPEGIFDNWNIHIHVPEGAIPKDGPSAGITMVTSLASALTQRKVKANLAMTGEITLRGKVLPVGGIREKILAAKRAGIKDIILCEENRKDINEIQPMYLTGMTFHYVKDIKEVLRLALTDEKVADAIDFTIKEDKNKENPAQ